MNWRRAALAAGAGTVGAATLYFCLSLLSPVELRGGSLLGTSPEENARLWVRLVLLLLIYFIAFGVSGAMPARMLDAGWRRSLVSSVAAHAVAIVGSAALVILLDLPERRIQAGALILVLGIALTLLFATRTVTVSLPFIAMTAVVAVAAVLTAPEVGGYVGLVAWVILPAVVALTRAR